MTARDTGGGEPVIGICTLLAFPFVAVLGVWSFFNPARAATVFAVGAYAFALLLLISIRSLRPQGNLFLSDPNEIAVYRRHFVALVWPGAAMDFGRALNMLRLAGLAALPWLLWNHLWIHSAFCAGFFYFTGHLCVTLQPFAYFRNAAWSGNKFAAHQLATLASVCAKRDAFNREPEPTS